MSKVRLTSYVLISYKPTELMPANHDAQNLRGTLADRQQPLVAIDSLDRELLAVAIATEDLDRVAANFFADLGGEELGHRRLLAKGPRLIFEPSGLVDQ